MLQSTGTVAAAAMLGIDRRALAAPRGVINQTTVISREPKRYHGWPTVARRRNGELLVVCSGGREAHVCPFGRVELIRSDDDGRTWSDARILLDGPIDDRDAGVMETARGTILVTTFTSLAYESILVRSACGACLRTSCGKHVGRSRVEDLPRKSDLSWARHSAAVAPAELVVFGSV